MPRRFVPILFLCACKHFAHVPVHGGMSGESCARASQHKAVSREGTDGSLGAGH